MRPLPPPPPPPLCPVVRACTLLPTLFVCMRTRPLPPRPPLHPANPLSATHALPTHTLFATSLYPPTPPTPTPPTIHPSIHPDDSLLPSALFYVRRACVRPSSPPTARSLQPLPPALSSPPAALLVCAPLPPPRPALSLASPSRLPPRVRSSLTPLLPTTRCCSLAAPRAPLPPPSVPRVLRPCFPHPTTLEAAA